MDSYRWQGAIEEDRFRSHRENSRSGLPDDAACIGDRYQIGKALFEITQPERLLSCRHPDERATDAGLPFHRRPGFYFASAEGEVGAGDET
jgi:MOSC domain-containing protein YiiM